MEEIQIDITITMGETCSNTMSLNEARALYLSLNGLFSFPTTSGFEPKVSGSAGILEKRKEVEVEEPKLEEMEKIDPDTPPPNLKVEAARRRTAKRTKNCGSR